jgi:hypothetical protein
MAAFWAAGAGLGASDQSADPLAGADSLIQAGNYEDALLALTDYLALNPDRSDDVQSRMRQIVLHYQAQKNGALAEVDSLISRQGYDAAVLFLKEFINLNPERFDEAQARLHKVIGIRENYNKVAQDLLGLFTYDRSNAGKLSADDEEKVKAQELGLIARLESIDRNNRQTKDFIARTKATATFVYNAAQFDRIFADGRGLIDQGKYAEAAQRYESGLALYREDFDASADAITKQSVASLVDGLHGQVAAFVQAQAVLPQAVAAFRDALASGDPASAESSWPAARDALEDRARRRDAVVTAGRTLAGQFALVQSVDKTATDSSFLPFAFRFTLGRSTSAQPEGIVGAMDTQWKILLDGMESAFEKALDAHYQTAAAAYDAGKWDEAATGFDQTAALSSPGLAAMGLWALAAPTDMLPVATEYGKSVLLEKPVAYEREQHLAVAAHSEAELARIHKEMEAGGSALTEYAGSLGPTADLASALAGFKDRRQAVLKLEARIQAEKTAAEAASAELARWNAQGLTPRGSAAAQQDHEARIGRALDDVAKNEIAVVSAAFGFEYGRLKDELAQRQADLDKGKALLQGIPASAASASPPSTSPTTALTPPTTTPASSQAGAEPGGQVQAPVILLYYPGQSVQLLVQEAPQIKDFLARIADYRGRIAGETPRVVGDPAIVGWADKAKALEADAAALEADRAKTLAAAQDRKRQADSARLDGERLVSESRRFLAASDFDTALKRLASAQDRYQASFGLEDNPGLRSAWDATNRQLNDDIGAARRTKATADINRFIKDGKSNYFAGLFTKAEENLLQARALRNDVFGVVDPEVEYWVKLSEAALSVNTGRTIPSTAPLYPEMSQLISLARVYYDQGQNLLTQKRRDEALTAFDQARDKINQVKVVFPLNQEAGVLALRIDQIIDPTSFRQEFADKYNAAKAGLKAPTNDIYAQLTDLASIDPKYPGLQDAIYQAEILLGRRLPPPDPAKQRQARDLVTQARAIVDSGDAGRFQVALDQIARAIQLDPNNVDAPPLKDRILTYQGSAAQVVLSSYAEEQYRLAVQEFQNGNFLQANAIVEQLLQDPKNRNSQKLLDLSKRIKARL